MLHSKNIENNSVRLLKLVVFEKIVLTEKKVDCEIF